MLLMLLGLAPLLVRGLQVEPTTSFAAAASQFSQVDYHHPVQKKKSALLIVAGLTRHMEATWPALEKAVVEPNEQAGYTFKIIFSTNLNLECNRKSKKWSSRTCEEPSSDPKGHMDRIKKIMGARDVTVLHDDKVCREHHRLEGLRRPGGDDDLGLPLDEVDLNGFDADGRTYLTVCSPWFERVHRVLAQIVESGEKFDRVVALRPDIVLTPPTSCNKVQCQGFDPFVEPPHLQLDKMCAQKPGFSFVDTLWQVQHRTYLHDRDLDFMHILCPGEEIPAYAEAIRVPLEPCSHRPYPPLPPGFHSSKGWHDKALFCRFVQVFTDRNVSISHWDDTVTAVWPHYSSFYVQEGSV